MSYSNKLLALDFLRECYYENKTSMEKAESTLSIGSEWNSCARVKVDYTHGNGRREVVWCVVSHRCLQLLAYLSLEEQRTSLNSSLARGVLIVRCCAAQVS
jgi:hypothetical protein